MHRNDLLKWKRIEELSPLECNSHPIWLWRRLEFDQYIYDLKNSDELWPLLSEEENWADEVTQLPCVPVKSDVELSVVEEEKVATIATQEAVDNWPQ